MKVISPIVFVISPILLLELRRLWPLPFESKNFDGLQDKVTAVSSNSAEQQAQRVSTDGTRVSQWCDHGFFGQHGHLGCADPTFCSVNKNRSGLNPWWKKEHCEDEMYLSNKDFQGCVLSRSRKMFFFLHPQPLMAGIFTARFDLLSLSGLTIHRCSPLAPDMKSQNRRF